MDDDWEAIFEVVRAIPAGKVLGYGQVGDRAGVGARLVGFVMAQVAEEDKVPWYRVVGSDGTLRITRRSTVLAQEQRRRLEGEGVVFLEDGRVAGESFLS